jgi:hypothetical protein
VGHVDDTMMENFRVPFVRSPCREYVIKFIACTFFEECKAEIFLIIKQIRRKHLQNSFEQLGARHVFIHSFPVNDKNKLASKFFGRVLQKAFSSEGSKLLVRGSTMLLPTFIYTDANDNEDDEISDVVKKRRAMAAASFMSDESQAALAIFEDFERSVLPALNNIRASDDENRRLELQDMEENLLKGIIPVSTGGVYFAWSSCLRCMKIGATRRQDPSLRLRELSSYVTVPFVLTGWIPTQTPFRKESLAHAYFASSRIRTDGAGTEFFKIDAAAVVAYCKNVNQIVESSISQQE